MEGSPTEFASSTEEKILIELFSLPPPPSITPLHSPQELQARYDQCVAQSRERLRGKLTTSHCANEVPDSVIPCMADIFLSHCPTLELSSTEVGPLIQQLLSQSFSDPQARSKIKKELEGLNLSYLQSLYDAPEKQEADRFRRVDVDRSRRILISNTEGQSDSAKGDPISAKSTRGKKIAECVSCLTRGQHQHYNHIVKLYMRDRRRPPASTPSHPDTTIVLDLIEAEQTCFLAKLKRETCECAQCLKEDVDGHLSHSALEASNNCINHNFLGNLHFRRFAQHRRIQRLSERVESFLTLAKMAVEIGGGGSPCPGSLSVADKKPAREKNWVHSHTSESFSRYGHLITAGHSVQVKLVLGNEDEEQRKQASTLKEILPLVLPSRGTGEGRKTIFTAEDDKTGEVEGSSNGIALPFTLDVNSLIEVASAARHVEEENADRNSSGKEMPDDKELSEQFPKKSTSKVYWDDTVDGVYTFHNPVINPMVAVLDPRSSGVSVLGFSSSIKGFSMALSFEAMLTLLTVHISRNGEGSDPLHNGFRLPILARVVQPTVNGHRTDGTSPGHDESFEVHLEIGNPFPREKETRRSILVDAMEYLISHNKSISPFLQERGQDKVHEQVLSTTFALTNANGNLDESRQINSQLSPNRKANCCATLMLSRLDNDPGSSRLENSRASGNDSFFTQPLYLNVVHRAVAFQDGVRPVFVMVKVNYLNKCPSLSLTTSFPPSVQSPASPLLRESFSIDEILELCLLFRCFPTAIVRVYYVNAYFSYIFGITDFTRSTWETALTMRQDKVSLSVLEDLFTTPAVTQSEDFHYAYESLFDVLHAVCRRVLAKVAETLNFQKPSQTALQEVANFHYLLVKSNKPKKNINQEAAGGQQHKKHGHRHQNAEGVHRNKKYDLLLYRVDELYPKFELQFNKNKEAESLAFVEGASSEVCEREYLPPDNWIYRDSIPFTFPPAKVS
ncbi:unnamed protein product [Phytomonas sp. Hart1]|nr:unnamed protein product [Phytomonas sp. Hart1]|eukprot:CCW69421.1 unnamed protein product [Phytomonas sp. isolate Hart1]